MLLGLGMNRIGDPMFLSSSDLAGGFKGPKGGWFHFGKNYTYSDHHT